MIAFNEDLRYFLEKKPLYSWVNIELPDSISQFHSLDKVEMECPVCKKSRPFTDRKITK